LIRPSIRFASALALVALSLPLFHASAQQDAPAAPTSAPSSPAPAAAPSFPKPDPENFTAASPTKAVVNAFVQTSWGFDDSRIWEVWAIKNTPAEGVSRVSVLVGDKSGKQKPAVVEFYVLPDGKHILAQNEILPFGEHPYAEFRALAQKRADGPYRGSAMKDLEIIEFADFQCPHCKDAQANMDKLAVDFPKARIIFQTFPLSSIHPQAARSAAYGVCVTKQGGSNAFFTFASAVYDGQEGLATEDGATLTLNSAVTKAGLDPAKIAECAATPATVAAVDAMVKLAEDLNINATPTLLVNGRQVPANAPYDTLKQIILYQAKLDNVAVQ
jgi:protein-disulfide isomerase